MRSIERKGRHVNHVTEPERESLVFSRQELVAATERIHTNNGVRAGSADMMGVWQGR
jgi:hypothetical protein